MKERTVEDFYTDKSFNDYEASAITGAFLSGKSNDKVFEIVDQLLKLEFDAKIGEGKDPAQFLREGPARAALIHGCIQREAVNDKMFKGFLKNPRKFFTEYKMPDFLLQHFKDIIKPLAEKAAFNDVNSAMHWVYFSTIQPVIVRKINETKGKDLVKDLKLTKEFFTSDPNKMTPEYSKLLKSTFEAVISEGSKVYQVEPEQRRELRFAENPKMNSNNPPDEPKAEKQGNRLAARLTKTFSMKNVRAVEKKLDEAKPPNVAQQESNVVVPDINKQSEEKAPQKLKRTFSLKNMQAVSKTSSKGAEETVHKVEADKPKQNRTNKVIEGLKKKFGSSKSKDVEKSAEESQQDKKDPNRSPRM